MNEKYLDILKYFFLTFSSLEIMYYIARSSFNLGLVFLVSAAFTILYAMDKFKVIGRLLESQHNASSKNAKKDQAY